ncbi:hypothetical protein [Dyella humicola]|uniref:hypothetical protein n=1 Tax=Dyella humicola TaxID=2992126 RepID=UPI002253E091|nr:hypothetical protein [Dyella humicola]
MAGLLAASSCAAAAPEPARATTVASSIFPVSSTEYYATASQLSSPLRPFAHLPEHAPSKVHTAVVTLPDPVETRLGRAFDIEMTALISAFQADDYVLDSFAFSWKPRAADGSDVGVSAAEVARRLPSVMLFRKDLWRQCSGAADPGSTGAVSCDSDYYVLFLVGETPSFGIHPEAFRRAARCALALDGGNRLPDGGFPQALSRNDCDQTEAILKDGSPVAWNCQLHLNVIGPAFSGAMESMVAALSQVAQDAESMVCATGAAGTSTARRHFGIELLTPSASVDSNENVPRHTYLAASKTAAFKTELTYHSLAYSVADQMSRVRRYLQTRLDSDDAVILLSEESSFGQGATVSAATPGKTGMTECPIHGSGWFDAKNSPGPCLNPIVSVLFPPNIAAIRSEHVKLKQDQDSQRRALLPSRVLELDLTGVENGVDQPPTYQPSLSSRSDELTLLQTFDALNKYVHPKAAIVVATDVRDRLFLLSELRDSFPGALPVLLEQDNLIVHPDYRNTSRGSITMPAGDSLVCMSKTEGLSKAGNLVSCAGAPTSPPGAALQDDPSNKRYFTFATDYAANTFRAVVCLLGSPSDPGVPFGCSGGDPHMLVATLAGFQFIDEGDFISPGGLKRHRDLQIVSDTRIELQQPVYLSMLVVLAILFTLAAWQIYNGRAATLVMLPISRFALRWMDLHKPAAVSDGVGSPAVPDASKRPSVEGRLGLRLLAMHDGTGSKTSFRWLVPWLTFALVAMVIAVYKILAMSPPASPRDTDLAHGRDPRAAICLVLAYSCVLIFTTLRMRVWNERCREMAEHIYATSRLKARLLQRGHIRALIAAVVLLVTLSLCINEYEPASVDNIWLSGLSGAFALGSSSFFLVLFLEGLDRWRCISLELGKTVPEVRRLYGWADWPSPRLLDERPRSPFNIVLRIDNYNALSKPDTATWMGLTNYLLVGSSFDISNQVNIRDWQAHLVAEMKVAAESVRTCVWSSILGAAVALMLMQVYTPVYERLQTMAATVLLTIGFGGIVYAVLTLEKDFLLGRMFTNDKDGLTFAGALAALWPKLLALGSLLVTVFLPNAWDWLGGIVKAVNSLH